MSENKFVEKYIRGVFDALGLEPYENFRIDGQGDNNYLITPGLTVFKQKEKGSCVYIESGITTHELVLNQHLIIKEINQMKG